MELDGETASTPLAPGATKDDEQPMDVDVVEHVQVQRNELSFQLEPIEQQPPQERIRHKRKRKLIIDEQKNISGEEMKANMADYR
jgi:cohesin complex subunit SCC1